MIRVPINMLGKMIIDYRLLWPLRCKRVGKNQVSSQVNSQLSNNSEYVGSQLYLFTLLIKFTQDNNGLRGFSEVFLFRNEWEAGR